MELCLWWWRPGFDPLIGKIPWRRKKQATPVSLPGKCHRQRSLVGCSPWDRRELGTTEQLMLSHFKSDSLRPHELQHARLPLESVGAFSNWYPLNHLILCRPLLLLPSIFPSIRVFIVSWLFASGGWSIDASALASVLPMNIHGWFPLG